MAYSITKPNIYFSGDKRILTETVASGISKFNVVMTHAKDSMYYVIGNSTKDTIEIAVKPFKTDTNCVLTNYIMFPNDFSGKTISFSAPDGYEIYYTEDYTRAKYTENTIIAIQQISSNKIVICLEKGEKEYKYGVLLTLETTVANETVHYHKTDSSIDSIEFYWDYKSEDNLGDVTHDNYHTYSEPGKHKLLVLSDTNLAFARHNNYTITYNISKYLIQIDKYKECIPLLNNDLRESSANYYFEGFAKLQKITTNEIFSQKITSFLASFGSCHSLISIPAGLFDKNENVTTFESCFAGCKKIETIPDNLFAKNTKATSFKFCFQNCSNLASIPPGLFSTNEQATNFWHCFFNCDNLKEIPAELFSANEQATNFYECFFSCDNLKEIPAGLFSANKQVTDFSGCFGICYNVTGNVPDLWNTHSSAKGDHCYRDCEKADNWEDIPSSWGGPKT